MKIKKIKSVKWKSVSYKVKRTGKPLWKLTKRGKNQIPESRKDGFAITINFTEIQNIIK